MQRRLRISTIFPSRIILSPGTNLPSELYVIDPAEADEPVKIPVGKDIVTDHLSGGLDHQNAGENRACLEYAREPRTRPGEYRGNRR